MKIVVDFGLCEANGMCVGAAPEVFALDDEDNLSVLVESPDAGLRDAVQQAVDLCPRAAITLEDE